MSVVVAALVLLAATGGQPRSNAANAGASLRYMELWRQADQAIHVWEGEQTTLAENVNGENGYQADCVEAQHDSPNWDYVAMDGRNLKEQASYGTSLLEPYRDAIVNLLDKLRGVWPHGSAKWGKVQLAATKISAALAGYGDAMKAVRRAGDSYIGRDCKGASGAFADANASLRAGVHKLAVGMADAKALAAEADLLHYVPR
jgi:hypothetical protein